MRPQPVDRTMKNRNLLSEKLKESTGAVLPIVLIVCAVCMVFVPIESGLLLSFLLGSVMLIAGMAVFSVGADLSMSKIGGCIGAKMTKSKKVYLILLISFFIGAAITISEPDLQVLATNVPEIDKTVLILTVSVGVGLFLMICMIRILTRIQLRIILIASYALVFIELIFVPSEMWAVAFDSGGVTTGPMTVPFIMALGVGVASIRSDEKAKSDSFGLVALCSVGPILAVMLLGLIYKPRAASSEAATAISLFENTKELGYQYIARIPEYLKEVALALLPIFAFFLVFQIVSLRLRKQPLVKILSGVFYTYVGLTLFLTGANVGFSPLGVILGGKIADSGAKYLLIPLAMLMGWFIIKAEPAVQILTKQVEELSAGAISGKAMGVSLSIAIAAANGLAMARLLTGVSILWFVIPGYVIALGLSFFVPATFTGIAFDSGGVASGPLTAAFMLPMAMGACKAIGGNIMTDAFGLVALVAMMPLITVQIMGVIYTVRSKRAPAELIVPNFGDDEVIELWEVA